MVRAILLSEKEANSINCKHFFVSQEQEKIGTLMHVCNNCGLGRYIDVIETVGEEIFN